MFKKIILILLLVCTVYISKAQYNYYYGNLHSHSSYSDGNKDSLTSGYYHPGQNFTYAKSSFHMDFEGISEHNHYNALNNPGMHVADYERGLQQADTSTVDGTFVSLYGFEWGVINNGGHVVVYGIPGLVGWETGSGAWGSTNNYDIFCAKSNYKNFWPIVNNYSDAFCTLAHPQDLDYNDLIGAATYNIDADFAIAGMSIRSGGAFSTTTNYSDPAASLYDTSYRDALAKGYHLGPTIDHDNHNSTFGRTNHGRTVVLANALTRNEIMGAYKANRFYASDDWDARINFTVNGNVMGSNLTLNTNSSINVTITDVQNNVGAADPTKKIEIFYGIAGSSIRPTILTSNLAQNNLIFTHTTALSDSFYYYAKITQTDNDIIWTSPIWVKRSSILPASKLLSFEAIDKGNYALLQWNTSQDFNTAYFEIEYSTNGITYENIGQVNNNSFFEYLFLSKYLSIGLNYYRLKMIDINGAVEYSKTILITKNKTIATLIISPNPVVEKLSFTYNTLETENIFCKIYNANGREVLSTTKKLFKGKNDISIEVLSLQKGFYFLVLSKPNVRIAEGSFLKL